MTRKVILWIVIALLAAAAVSATVALAVHDDRDSGFVRGPNHMMQPYGQNQPGQGQPGDRSQPGQGCGDFRDDGRSWSFLLPLVLLLAALGTLVALLVTQRPWEKGAVAGAGIAPGTHGSATTWEQFEHWHRALHAHEAVAGGHDASTQAMDETAASAEPAAVPEPAAEPAAEAGTEAAAEPPAPNSGDAPSSE